MWKFVYITVLITVYRGYLGNAEDLHRTIARLQEKNPALSALSNRLFYPGIQHTKVDIPQVSSEQLEKWKFLLRFANLQQDMPMKKLLDGAAFPDLNKLININFYDILQELRSDQVMLEQLSRKFNSYVQHQKARHSSRMAGESQKGREDMSEEELYEECAKDYDSFLIPLTNLLANIMVPDCSETNGTCREEELCRPKQIPNGRRMIDASFKIPEGIPEGKLHWIGSYEYCNEIHIEYNWSDQCPESKFSRGEGGVGEIRKFDGQYARLDLTPYSMNGSLALLMGVCSPSTCTEQHIYRYITQDNILLQYLLEEVLHMNITFVYLRRNFDSSTDTRLHLMLGVMVLLIILMVTSTIYDGLFRRWVMKKEIQKLEDKMIGELRDSLQKDSGKAPPTPLSKSSKLPSASSANHPVAPEDENNLKKEEPTHLPKYPLSWRQRLELAFVGFSVYSNFGRIFSIKDRPDHLRVLDGIRVLSYGWLLIGETALLGIIYTEVWTTANLITSLIRWPKLWYGQIFPTFILSIDSFLFISGVLMSYWWLRKLEGKSLSAMFAFKYFVHKIWRLWVPMAFTMMCYVPMAAYSEEGPLLPPRIGDATNCYDTWWSTLLMVNNFVNTKKPCMTWTTHIAILAQIHLAAMFILVTLSWRPKLGCSLLAATYIAHIGAVAGITSAAHGNRTWYDDFFMAPWCRAGPYVVGMATGILIFHYKYKGLQIRTHPVIMVAGMGAAIAGIFGVVFATHDMFKEGGEVWGKSTMVAYHIFSHNTMGLGLAWITVASVIGYGGVVGSLLSLRMWQPLSKLVYQAMLFHSGYIYTWVFYRMSLLYLHMYQLLYITVGHFWRTMRVGLIFSNIWQFPICVGLERALFCNNVVHWIQYGRHPRGMLRRLLTRAQEIGHKKEKSMEGVEECMKETKIAETSPESSETLQTVKL